MAEDRHAALLSPAEAPEASAEAASLNPTPETIALLVQICTLKRVWAKVQRACACVFEEEDTTVKVRLLWVEFEFEVEVDELLLLLLLFATSTLLLK